MSCIRAASSPRDRLQRSSAIRASSRPISAAAARVPMLWLEDVHVHRGGTHALRGIDLEVRRGEIVALIGANGAGKTTTLAAISGLLRCQQGRIGFAPEQARIDISRVRAEKIVAA